MSNFNVFISKVLKHSTPGDSFQQSQLNHCMEFIARVVFPKRLGPIVSKGLPKLICRWFEHIADHFFLSGHFYALVLQDKPTTSNPFGFYVKRLPQKYKLQNNHGQKRTITGTNAGRHLFFISTKMSSPFPSSIIITHTLFQVSILLLKE